MAYTTATDLKTYMGGDMPTDDDTLLTALIARAQQIIDTYTRRTFEASEDATRYFDAETDVSDDRRQLWLGRHELCAITSVTNGDGNSVAANQYVTEPRNTAPYYALTMKLNADSYWTWDDSPENAIAIVGRWAYSTTAPADIVQACTRLAKWLYNQRDNADGDRAVVTSDGSMVLPMRLPKDITHFLEPYVRRV